MTGRSPGLLRRHRDFRLLWCGETAGKFGAAVTNVAMPLVAVSTLHAPTFAVGLLSACTWLPWLLIGLPVGVWVDRLRRRPLMLGAAGLSLVLFAAVPVLARYGGLSLGLLITVALLTGAAAVVFQTAYSAYLPALLAPADQPEGNAKLHGSASAAQIAGQGAGGLIAQLAGAVNGLFAHAATFLIALLCLLGIRHREPRPAPRAAPRALTAEVAEGLRLVAGDRWFRTLTLFGAASNLALMGYQSMATVFLVREVGLSPGTVGGVLALASTGGIAGAFLARRAADRFGTARAMLLCELGLPGAALLIPLAAHGAGALLYVAGSFGVSAGVVAGNILKASFQQRYCPPALLGRLIASSSFVNYGTLPLGALLGGALGSALGLRPAMWIMTAGVPLAALILLFSPVGTVRDLPTRPTGEEQREPGEGGPDPERRGGPDPEQGDGPGPGTEGRDGASARR
ncbi:MFS transporter [Streptomyces decoyicus]|uniref:MFS transporter n=1 Tax=Streptomyces decoyicus TaxID=249567 RepID=UPI00069F3D5C|nr:MFS transporter [Streptomyces decoyicus]KOG50508.1 MFS transporter [Streptomyces decoyicus]QZY15085.1 MFS transporter [Streptomyces decoyicus]